MTPPMSAAKRTFALPLLLLALLMQVLAPSAAAAEAAHMLDPLANLPICSTDRDGGQKDPASPAQHRDQDCAACTVCSSPGAALTPQTPAAPPALAAIVADRPRVEIVGPRGPPRRTAQARAPPIRA